MQYIDAVIDNKSVNTDGFYTYKAPDEVTVGSKLTVPFARRSKGADAYCVRTAVTTDLDDSKIKEIDSFDPERSLSAEMVGTAMWMRKRYGIKYIDGLKMFAVDGKREKALKSDVTGPSDSGYELTPEQSKAAERICASIRKSESRTFLIKGVTNSGKTEVYMQAVAEALSMGKTAIVLLPEIALASQVGDRFRERFGAEKVATLHSRLKKSERLSEWLRVRRGEAQIVVGARTSVFAPLENIGIIIIDEEHESTYKSDHNPKYETVDIAFKRASLSGAVLVLGSATPSVTSYYRAKNGIYDLIEMNERIGGSRMPVLETVDMRKEVSSGNSGVLSRELAAGIDRSLARGEQVILFLNRRGFSTRILCPDCGHSMTCPDCGITLTYHKSVNAAVCHYCGRKFPVPSSCPDCGSRYIKYAGAGTEKVEEEVRRLWPKAGVDRFDIDTASAAEDPMKVISDFQSGKTDILVGTQILAKGLDFRNVGLVGIINADVSLNIPDYRSSERTFQLITQVAGRAGRKGGDSRVLIQTYDPESDVIREAAAGDYESFFGSELLHRSIMNYPPYSDIISVGFTAADDDTAMAYAEAFRNRLIGLRSAPEGAVVMRPRFDERRTDGKSRAVFLIKAPQGSRAGYVSEYMAFRDRMTESKAPAFIEIDVNPYGMI
ncbi:MAG: primosomal protein N' [Clostridiales bacterium]|nr:primosomal protein N' [Clostridiales bacterium]